MTQSVEKSASTEASVPGPHESRAQATAARKQQVVAAALKCFTDKGVEKTTVADICRESGCSVGSLYHHFGTQEGVAGALFIHAIELLNADLLARLQRCRSVASGVRMVVTQYSDWVTAHPDYARFLHSGEVEFTPTARTRLREIYLTHIGAVFGWFHPYVVAGQMRALPPETYVPLISGPIRDYTRQWLSGRVQKEPAAVKAVFAEAAWNSVRGVQT